ncbi:MAG: nuclear transport factor 2 family protein [Planctomycetes bacterium]|nr:nuclear transport factor 2 family protein [Planctomycetota bacterium]MBL7037096.1 nuclear transport factor 2 family protein [Pirellulaceae bacterium]
MNMRANFESLTTLMRSGDNEECWQKYYSEDVVRRYTNVKPWVGRETCRQRVQEFLDGLTSTPRVEWKTVAFDDDNQVSIFEIYHEFSHKAYGDIRQTEVHVQRWRDGKIYDESIYLMPLNEEADSEACS